MSPNNKYRQVATVCLYLSLLFIILGFGNYFIGNDKLSSYKSDLVKIAENTTINNKITYHIKSRIEYYSLVVIGGKCFIIIACCLGLLSIFLSAPSNLNRLKH